MSMGPEKFHLAKEFIHAWSSQQNNRAEDDSSTVNILHIIELGNDEIRHSAILAWLLSAKANHHQGDLFLKAFVQACGMDLLTDSLGDYEVCREYQESEAAIDVMVYSEGRFLVYIENKVDSPEGPNQCDRELRDMHMFGDRKNVPLHKRYAIFLTPHGDKPASGDKRTWITLSYSQLDNALRPLLSYIRSDKVRYAVEDWLEVMSDFSGGNMSVLFCDKSIQLIQHWGAINEILGCVEKLDQELLKFLSSLESDLRHQNWWQDDWEFIRSMKSQPFISKSTWKSNKERMVQIGVEGFTSKKIFDGEPGAQLYVWTPRKKLAKNLIDKLARENDVRFGRIDTGDNSYVVRQPITKCLPADIDRFDATYRKQIIDFMAHYARVLARGDYADIITNGGR